MQFSQDGLKGNPFESRKDRKIIPFKKTIYNLLFVRQEKIEDAINIIKMTIEAILSG